jgi:hypothetical protein
MNVNTFESFGSETILGQRKERLIGEAILLSHAGGPLLAFLILTGECTSELHFLRGKRFESEKQSHVPNQSEDDARIGTDGTA